MSEVWEDFYRLGQHLLDSALTAPDCFSTDTHPFVSGLDWLTTAREIIFSQVQLVLDDKLRRHLVFELGRKTGKVEQSYSGIKGKLNAFFHTLRKWEHILRFDFF